MASALAKEKAKMQSIWPRPMQRITYVVVNYVDREVWVVMTNYLLTNVLVHFLDGLFRCRRFSCDQIMCLLVPALFVFVQLLNAMNGVHFGISRRLRVRRVAVVHEERVQEECAVVLNSLLRCRETHEWPSRQQS